jgi:hypothetical protein
LSKNIRSQSRCEKNKINPIPVLGKFLLFLFLPKSDRETIPGDLVFGREIHIGAFSSKLIGPHLTRDANSNHDRDAECPSHDQHLLPNKDLAANVH